LQQRHLRIVVLTAAVAALLSSCQQPPSPPPATIELTPEPTPPLLPTRTQTITPTSTQVPSSTPTQPPHVSVSENTNCRTGPGADYLFQGVLEVGDVADVVGRSPEPGYWYVTGADLPKEGCWLLGEYAQVDGEVEALPAYTAAPSPTPQVGFDVTLRGFESCGSTVYVVFAVKNVGGQRIWSGYVDVQNYATGDTLYSGRRRHPFADTVLPVCPPGHGNELWPGETRYIHAPISSVDSGSTAIGTITLCTADHQGGTCKSEYSYFELP
jgi:hypothetical protein